VVIVPEPVVEKPVITIEQAYERYNGTDDEYEKYKFILDVMNYGDISTIPFLESIVYNEKIFVASRDHALRGLKRLDKKVAIATCEKILMQPLKEDTHLYSDEIFRCSAINILNDILDIDTLPLIRARYEDPLEYEQVRRTARFMLTKLDENYIDNIKLFDDELRALHYIK